MQDYKRIRTQVDLGNNRTSRSRQQFPEAIAGIYQCRSYLLSHHYSSCHPWECQSHHVGLEDDDDDDGGGCWRTEFCGSAKYSALWKLSNPNNCCSSGSSVLFWRVLDLTKNAGHSLSFSFLKTCKSSGCFFVSRSLPQGSRLLVRVEASQMNLIVISCPLSSRCIVADIELHNKIQVFYPFICPINCVLVEMFAEIVCTSFLVATSTCNMVSTSFLDAVIGFFHARFSPFWFLKCWE